MSELPIDDLTQAVLNCGGKITVNHEISNESRTSTRKLVESMGKLIEQSKAISQMDHMGKLGNIDVICNHVQILARSLQYMLCDREDLDLPESFKDA